jgi:tripartite-type tricarboxylate transporter receptor subunit TctC
MRSSSTFPKRPGRIDRRSFIAMSAAALALPRGLRAAPTYPTKPVRIVVPYGPGGIADVTMRLVADQLSKKFNQQFFIENRPGAGGVVGIQAALSAPPDGYTMMMIGGGLCIAKALFKHLPYDIEKDIQPVSTTASYGLVVVSKAGSKYQTIKDVVAAAKAKPGSLNVGTINAGSTQNLSAELFRIRAGIDVAIVPYKTTPELASAVLRGDVDLAFEYFAGVQSPIVNKQVTVLATTGKTRAANLPDVPTVMQAGVADYDVTSWNGLGVHAGTPAELVTLLHNAVDEALKSDRVQTFSKKAGMDAKGMDPAAMKTLIKSDVATWTEVIQKAGIKKR